MEGHRCYEVYLNYHKGYTMFEWAACKYTTFASAKEAMQAAEHKAEAKEYYLL